MKVVIITGGREGEVGKESNKKLEEGKADRRMDMMVYALPVLKNPFHDRLTRRIIL